MITFLALPLAAICYISSPWKKIHCNYFYNTHFQTSKKFVDFIEKNLLQFRPEIEFTGDVNLEPSQRKSHPSARQLTIQGSRIHFPTFSLKFLFIRMERNLQLCPLTTFLGTGLNFLPSLMLMPDPGVYFYSTIHVPMEGFGV